MKKVLLVLALCALLNACGNMPNFVQHMTYMQWETTFETGDGTNPDNDIIFLVDNSDSMMDEIRTLTNSLAGLKVSLLSQTDLKFRVHATPFSNTYFNSYYDYVGADSYKLWLNNGYVTAEKTNLTPFDNFLSNLTTVGTPPEAGIALAARYMDQIYKQPSPVKRITHFVMLSDEDNQKKTWVYGGPQGTSGEYAIRLTTANESRFQFTWDKKTTYQLQVMNQCRKTGPAMQSGYNFWCTDSTGAGRYAYQQPEALCDVHEKFKCKYPSDNGSTREGEESWTQYLGRSSIGLDDNLGCTADLNSPILREFVRKWTDFRDPLCYRETSGGGFWFDWNYCQENKIYPPEIDASTCDTNISCSPLYVTLPITFFKNSSGVVTSMSKQECPAGYEPSNTYTYTSQTTPFVFSAALTGNLPKGWTLYDYSNYSKTETFYFDHIATEAEARAAFDAKYPNATDEVLNNFGSYSGVDGRSNTNQPDIIADPAGFQQFVERFYPGQKVVFNAIVAKSSDYCPGMGTTGAKNVKGEQYLALAEATGGVQGDICNPSFDAFMQKLADQIKLFAKPNRKLPGRADTDAILVVKDIKTGRYFKEGPDFVLDAARENIFFKTAVPNQTISIELYTKARYEDEQENGGI